MAKNQRYTNALHIEVTAPYARTAGQPVRVGQICGVAINDAANGARTTVWLDGSWEIDVAGALTEGQAVYITSAGALTATATGNFVWGVALAPKAAGTGPAEVAPVGYTTQTAASA